MTDFARFRLVSPKQAHDAFTTAYRAIKPLLDGDHRYDLIVRPEKRSDPANDRLHASIRDVARQVEWDGEMQDEETWKRLFVAAWCRVNGSGVKVLRALDGVGVDLVPRRTSKLSRAECSELQQFIYAWGAERGVKFSAPEDE